MSCFWREWQGSSSPPSSEPGHRAGSIRAAGSLKSGLALTPGSDPESASSFLRGASSWRSGHPVCGPWRSAARNWRWPCPPRRTQQARTPGRPVRAKLGHAKFLVRSDSAFFAACRAAPGHAPNSMGMHSPVKVAPPSCSQLAIVSPSGWLLLLVPAVTRQKCPAGGGRDAPG